MGFADDIAKTPALAEIDPRALRLLRGVPQDL
jgi:hypothetical protein